MRTSPVVKRDLDRRRRTEGAAVPEAEAGLENRGAEPPLEVRQHARAVRPRGSSTRSMLRRAIRSHARSVAPSCGLVRVFTACE